jgi:hypothetical protein
MIRRQGGFGRPYDQHEVSAFVENLPALTAMAEPFFTPMH